jgi:hypothetical protein
MSLCRVFRAPLPNSAAAAPAVDDVALRKNIAASPVENRCSVKRKDISIQSFLDAPWASRFWIGHGSVGGSLEDSLGSRPVVPVRCNDDASCCCERFDYRSLSYAWGCLPKMGRL